MSSSGVLCEKVGSVQADVETRSDWTPSCVEGGKNRPAFPTTVRLARLHNTEVEIHSVDSSVTATRVVWETEVNYQLP